MDTLNYLSTVIGDHLGSIDLVYAGVIALIFGLLTEGIAGVFFLPAIAAAIYIAAQAILEPLLHNTVFVMLQFDSAMAEQVLSLYVFFLVADTAVYAIKKTVAVMAH